MKSFANLQSHHPFIAMLIFDVVVSVVSLCVGVLIHYQTGMTLSTVVFLESLIFLLIAQSSVMGNAKLRTESFTVYREFKTDDSYNSAYLVALKYGLIGVILLSSTWLM
jgi:hypothetical protein